MTIGRCLLSKLVEVYPQTAYYPLRARFTFQPRPDPTEDVLRDLLRRLRQKNPQVLDIEQIGKELGDKVFKPLPEEGLCSVLSGLEIAQILGGRGDAEQSYRRYVAAINGSIFENEGRSQRASSPLLQALRPSFRENFLDESTREPSILKGLLRLKNLKDFLLSNINSREQTQHLEELSPLLAHMSRRAIEIPGQHVLSETEPLPQYTVYLDRFEPLVHRCGLSQRKIVFKGSNGKNYPFSASPANERSHLCGLSEERVIQLKVLMNMIFQRHKETLRRGAKFCVPSKFLWIISKLSSDAMTFQDFQETHDFLLQEKGVDPDIALLLRIRAVRQCLERAGEGEAGLSHLSRSPQFAEAVNQSYYEEMVGRSSPELCEDSCFVPPTLLTSYFHRIFYNVDDQFLFKKKFTTFHAVNSFLAYALGQTDQQTLSTMSFCKSTGRISCNDPTALHKSWPRPGLPPAGPTAEALEAARLESDSASMPFRLTPNFVEFIGQMGLYGLFAGVVTSCSLAISKHADKLLCFLQLALRDELAAATTRGRAPTQAQQQQ